VKRRAFIAALGGAAAWPLVARAQQPERMRRIGVLIPYAADDPESLARVGGFVQGLQQLGWTIGGNVRMEYRFSAGSADAARKYAAELVALAPDVILANGGAIVAPLLQLTRTVPVVFVQVTDPVGRLGWGVLFADTYPIARATADLPGFGTRGSIASSR
jgi:putative tryptophan/tyrosine transport system substrate-binding protein